MYIYDVKPSCVFFGPCDTHRCDRLNLCTNLLPSANQICREVTGRAWSSVTMGIGGDSPSSCTDGDLTTTLGATLGMDRDTNKKIKKQLKGHTSCTVYFYNSLLPGGNGQHLR